LAAIDSFRSRSEIVLVRTGGEHFSSLPENVRAALSSQEAGNTIPRLVVFDPALSILLATFPYPRLSSDARGASREASKAIADHQATSRISPLDAMKEEDAAQDESPAAIALPPQSSRLWTNTKGQSLTATLVSVADTTITLRRPDGTSFDYQIDQLDDGGKAYLDSLRQPAPDQPQ
jgi:hypothetical protein